MTKDSFVKELPGSEVVTPGHNVGEGANFITVEELIYHKKELLPGDTLTLSCEVTTVIQSTGSIVAECYTPRISECRIHHDIGCLLENQDFSDVTVVASDGREFRAHKAILGARSPVFAAMFKNEMAENKQNRVELADMDNDVISEMLRFIYTGTADNLDRFAAELLVAGDKYELKGLQNISENNLSKRMTVDNAAQFLVLADMYHMKDLKKTAIDFILDHSEEVKKTKGWMLMSKSHPQLILEALLFKPFK